MAMRRAAVGWAAAVLVSAGLLATPLVAFAISSAVTVQNFAFAPNSVTITVGDSISWTNRDAAAHSAKFSDRVTPVLSQGQSATLLFTTAGTFPYICGIHGTSMQGTIIVRAAATPPPTAPPTPVRTAPPTVAPTAPPTVAPTEAPTPSSTTAPPSPTASLTSAAAETPIASASPSAVAVQATPVAAANEGGLAPLLIGSTALAVVALGAVAFLLARRSWR
jgi:plastocyanin